MNLFRSGPGVVLRVKLKLDPWPNWNRFWRDTTRAAETLSLSVSLTSSTPVALGRTSVYSRRVVAATGLASTPFQLSVPK